MRARLLLVLMPLFQLLVIGMSGPVMAQQDTSAADPPISQAKLNGYIKGYNTLLGTFGLRETYDRYAGQRIARKTVKDSFDINDGWIDGGLDSLKAAQAEANGGLPELDAIGGKLIEVVDRVMGRLKSLKAYYQTKEYIGDGLARGKRDDPLVLDEFKQSLALLEEFSVALEVAISKRDLVRLEALRQSGDEVGYHGALALFKSKLLLGLFASPKDVRDAARLKRGDAIVLELSKALEETQMNLDAAKASGKQSRGMRDSFYGDVVQALQRMIGSYREMKAGGTSTSYSSMLTNYNDAVERANLAR